MIDQVALFLISVAFLLAVWRAALWDIRYWRCAFTPFAVVSVPFAILAASATLVAPALGLVQIDPAIFLVWLAGLSMFLAASWCVRRLVRIAPEAPTVLFDGERLCAAVPAARIITTIAASVAAGRLYSLLGDFGAIARLADEDFQTEFGAGIAGHIQAFAYPAVVILVAQGRRARRVDLLFIAFGMLGAILYQVKYIVLIPVTAGLILGVLVGNIRASVRSLALWSCGGVAASMMIYLVGFAALDPQSLGAGETYLAVSQHVLSYLLSGILAFSEFMRGGAQQFYGSESTVFIPFHNLWAVVYGGDIIGIEDATKFMVQVSEDGRRENVFTLFGTLYLYIGWFGMLIYSFVVGLCGYFTLAAARRCPNAWFACAPSLLLAFLAFGWFHSFFWLLTPFEVIVASLILATLSRISFAPSRRVYNS